VISAVNTGAIKLADFIRRGGAVTLTPAGRGKFLRAYERRMDEEITHPIFWLSHQLSTHARSPDSLARAVPHRRARPVPTLRDDVTCGIDTSSRTTSATTTAAPASSRCCVVLRSCGEHIQHSVFRCDLSDRQRIAMIAAVHP